MRKYYCGILGLPESARLDEIKAAFRRLAKKYHPDLNPSPDAKQQFIRVNEAYEYLSHENTARKQPATHSTRSAHGKNEKAKEDWEKRKKEEARKRAAHFAKMKFEEYEQSDLYRSALVYAVTKLGGCLLTAAALVLLVYFVAQLSLVFALVILLFSIPIIAFVMTIFEKKG